MPQTAQSFTARRARLHRISAHELGRPRARMGNPNTGIPEVIVQPLYDIYFIANNQAFAVLNLFSNPRGSQYNFMGVTAFAKTKNHTNLVQAGMLESSYTFVVRALAVFAQGLQGTAHPYLNAEDLTNFLSSYFRFEINQKPYFEGIGHWLPGGGGIVMGGVASLTAPAGAVNSTNGWSESRNVYPIPGGQYINPQENFGFIIDPTQNAGGAPSTLAAVLPSAGVPASGMSAWVRLDGTLIRVAQ